MKKILITLNFLLVLTSYGQPDSNLSTKAYPEIGWDSLSCLIQMPVNYPEIPRRASVTARLSVYLTIDSTGKFLKVEPAQIPTNASVSLINRLFIPSIWNVLKSVKWVPSKKTIDPLMIEFICYSILIYLNRGKEHLIY